MSIRNALDWQGKDKMLCVYCFHKEHSSCINNNNPKLICSCACNRKSGIFMSSKFIVLAAAGCISANTIHSKLESLDKYTDQAVIIKESSSCKKDVKPSICGLANACLSRSLFAASSCKTANDAAATKQPPDVQYVNDRACKSDLELAESACTQMKESKSYADMAINKDGSNNSISSDLRGPFDAGTGTETHD